MPEDKPVLDLPRTLRVVGDDPVDDADIANLLQLGERADITDEQIEGVWRPEDEVEADKAGRRWARADEQLRQHDTELAKMFDQIDEAAAAQRAIALGWHERVTAEPERRKWFYERTLKTYIERIREDSGDEIKSKKLPAVVVSSTRTAAYAKKVAGKEGEAKLVAWLKKLGAPATEALKVVPAKQVPVMDKVKRLVEVKDGAIIYPSTGEVVPGLYIEPENMTVEITPTKPAES